MRVTHYELLGLNINADSQQIQEAAYKIAPIFDKAKEWAKSWQWESCSIVSERINEAYSTLIDKKTREQYDHQLLNQNDSENDSLFRTLWQSLLLSYQESQQPKQDYQIYSAHMQKQMEALLQQNQALTVNLQQTSQVMKSFDEIYQNTQAEKRKDIWKLQVTNSSLQEKVSSSESEISSLTQEKENFLKEIEKLQKDVTILKTMKENAKDYFKSQLASQEEEIQNAQKTIKFMSEENQRLTKQLSEFSQQKEIESLQRQVASLNKIKENLQNNHKLELASKDRDIQETEKNVKMLCNKIHEISLGSQTLANKNSDLLQEIEKLKRENQALRQNQTIGVKREAPQDVSSSLEDISQPVPYKPVFVSVGQVPVLAMDIENNNNHGKKVIPHGLKAIYKVISFSEKTPEFFSVRLVFESDEKLQKTKNQFLNVIPKNCPINLLYCDVWGSSEHMLKVESIINGSFHLLANALKGKLFLEELNKYIDTTHIIPEFRDVYNKVISEDKLPAEFLVAAAENNAKSFVI